MISEVKDAHLICKGRLLLFTLDLVGKLDVEVAVVAFVGRAC